MARNRFPQLREAPPNPVGSEQRPSPVRLIVAVKACPCGTGIERRFNYCTTCYHRLDAPSRLSEARRLHKQRQHMWAFNGQKKHRFVTI